MSRPGRRDGWVWASSIWLCLVLVAAAASVWMPLPTLAPNMPGYRSGLVLWTLHGARTAVLEVVAVIALSVPVGTLLGGLAGSGSRVASFLLARSVELCGTWPSVLLIGLLLALGTTQGPAELVLCLGLLRAVHLGRLVRAETLRFGSNDFALAARALGVGRLRRFTRHLLPHLSGLVTSHAALCGAWVVTLETGLTLAGLGLPPDWPSWAGLLGQVRELGPEGAALPLLVTAWTALSLGVLAEAADETRMPERAPATEPHRPLGSPAPPTPRPGPS